jgi:hypothetical protein
MIDSKNKKKNEISLISKEVKSKKINKKKITSSFW